MSTNIATLVLEFLADDDDYDVAGNLTAEAVARFTAEAERNLNADQMRTIVNFEDRFIAALRSLATDSDYDAHSKLTEQAFDRLWREAWTRARPADYERLMVHLEATRIVDEHLDRLVAEGKCERYTDEATGEKRFTLFDEMDKKGRRWQCREVH